MTYIAQTDVSMMQWWMCQSMSIIKSARCLDYLDELVCCFIHEGLQVFLGFSVWGHQLSLSQRGSHVVCLFAKRRCIGMLQTHFRKVQEEWCRAFLCWRCWDAATRQLLPLQGWGSFLFLLALRRRSIGFVCVSASRGGFLWCGCTWSMSHNYVEPTFKRWSKREKTVQL